jgi:glucose/arabinose dehydrogenase
MRGITVLILAIATLAAPIAAGDSTSIPLALKLVASGLDRPVFVAAAPSDTSRLFILEQVTGRIRLVKDGHLLETPFLDIGEKVSDRGGERGLLGLAFHPDYADNGYFYVNYIGNETPGDTYIARYRVSENPDVADPASGTVLLRIDQPASNHNGGMLAFGPHDGYLYIALGDGGGSFDPNDNAQDRGSLLGKILRIDVDGGEPYTIPPDNPFLGDTSARPEIWAYGLRNPWRLSFDRLTSDLYIGDVGQGDFEEIDFQPADSPGGENYGWDVAEGFACAGGSGNCGTAPGFTPPIHAYGRDEGASTTGGYVYRGSAIPDLQGVYFFGDFISGRIWSFRYEGGAVTEFVERTGDLTGPGGETAGNVSSFGEDAAGELYVVSYGGTVYRIVSAIPREDVSGDGTVDAQDVQLVVNAVLGRNVGVIDADINRDGRLDAIDVQLTVNAALRAS